MTKIIFESLIIIHIFAWIFGIFGRFIGCNYAKINIYYYLPFIYFIHFFPFHIINESKVHYIKHNHPEVHDNGKFIKSHEEKYVIPSHFDKLKNLFNHSFQNPLSPQGLIILGFIINIYLLKYYYKEFN